MRTSQHSFRRAPAQRIEKIEMSPGSEYHEIGLPVILSFQDLVYNRALSDGDIIRPSGPTGRINQGCAESHMNQSKFAHKTIKSSSQKQSLAERRLRMGIVIDRDENFFQRNRTVF